MPARGKVAALPGHVRMWLDEVLQAENYSGYAVLEQEMRTRGYEISKSALHRHGQDLRKKLEAMRAATEWAKEFVAQNGDQEGVLNEATLASLQADAFRLMLNLRDSDETTDPEKRARILASVANSMANVARSSVIQKRWRATVSAPNLEEAQKILDRLMTFVQERFPGHAPAILEVLEPFGAVLAKEYPA
ncbi:hypothetical protein SIID45300_01035 [Candidatus Magnetaquicoccaceae bacterium FCR-1]|uniref:DUF3486 family protein n=1 Tax=Candidatus Magnetaquiglobus chichijimensis TaxID=3141448 RepID=A0ABQ0C765_9PROT